MIFSEILSESKPANSFPHKIEDPTNYYHGLDPLDRVVCRNVIVFERRSKKALQQKHLANRMHHRYVLMRSLKTAGTVSIDGKNLRLTEGDALLISPYQFHHYIDLEADSLRWVFITFELESGGDSLANLSYQALHPDEATHEMWTEIARLWTNKRSKQRLELVPILDQLLTRLHLSFAPDPNSETKQPHSKTEWIAEIESLIFRSVREGRTLQEVAQQAGFSDRHLRARFESQMGISLRDYRSNYQFHLAISMMRNANFSLADVAELSGFNSQSVFTRFIRRMSRQTPRELRKRIRANRFTLN